MMNQFLELAREKLPVLIYWGKNENSFSIEKPNHLSYLNLHSSFGLTSGEGYVIS